MSTFSPWQQRAFDQTVAALDADRLGHGLLICGPAGLGKREVALALADHVLARGDAAHATRTRQLIAAGTHPDLQLVSFIPNKSGDKLRTEIVIEQVREITDTLALTPQYGVAQVVIVDPADAINRSAANALLKTLEEPQPGRYLWLISSDPARLPQTIRSRCQRLEFKLPPQHEALAWLQQQGHSEASAREALDAAQAQAVFAQPVVGLACAARLAASWNSWPPARPARWNWLRSGVGTTTRHCACALPPTWRWPRPAPMP